MSLATVIRLEFAYPGVGVLAGDSLQYLSIATAHGVIMVFFMIMPTVFGAFGNFLLPTQLGVHDVAFPRLNSAAFWFLPGGLIMLCQLVCVDRRYARMNCFNIRELQGILKRRFFTDLVNSSDHREILDSSMIGLRFKTNNTLNLNHDVLSFHNFGTSTDQKHRGLSLENSYSVNYGSYNYLGFYLNSGFSLSSFASYSVSYFISHVTSFINFFYSFSAYNVCPSFSPLTLFRTALFNFNFSYAYFSSTQLNLPTGTSTSTLYKSSTNDTLDSSSIYTNLESSSNIRYNRFSNPVISYDYKCGHYLGI